MEELATRLVKAGHEVFVYTRPNYTDKNLKKYRGVNLISLKSIATKHLDALSHTLRACLDLTKREVNVIHFHSIGPSSLIWLARILKPGAPIIFTFHTKCYEHRKWGALAKLCLKIGELIACRLADQVIAISPSLSRYALARHKASAVYIPNGVSLPKLVKAEKIKTWGLKKDNYILTVTRLVGHKGVQYLIAAYQNLKTDKKLVIVGDGVYTDNYVKELLTAARGNKNIIFTGNQSGRELAELFSNAYLFVQPSESEGLSIALLEAMAYKKCSLVSDIAENKNAIGQAGFTFKNKNISSLKQKLVYLLKNKQLVARTGTLAQKRARLQYDWNNIMKEMVLLYKSALEEKENLKLSKFDLARKFVNFF